MWVASFFEGKRRPSSQRAYFHGDTSGRLLKEKASRGWDAALGLDTSSSRYVVAG